jgi:hypothetical protein
MLLCVLARSAAAAVAECLLAKCLPLDVTLGRLLRLLRCLACRPSDYLDSFNILLKAAAARVSAGGLSEPVGCKEVAVTHCVCATLLPANRRLQACCTFQKPQHSSLCAPQLQQTTLSKHC